MRCVSFWVAYAAGAKRGGGREKRVLTNFGFLNYERFHSHQSKVEVGTFSPSRSKLVPLRQVHLHYT